MSNPNAEPSEPTNEQPSLPPKPEESGDNPSVKALDSGVKSSPVLSQTHPEARWYVLRVQSGKEDKVRTSLESRVASMNMSDQILQVMVPTETISELRKNSKRVIHRKLYPGYVMVQMVKTEKTHYLVKTTPGVGDFAGEMSESEVERMMIACNTQVPIQPNFYKGQIVRIKEGHAFQNYDGVVDEVNEEKQSLKVRIEIFGRYTQVDLEYWQVEVEKTS